MNLATTIARIPNDGLPRITIREGYGAVVTGRRSIARNITEPDVTPPRAEYARTYTSFSGADQTFYCNGRAIGEIHSYLLDESDHSLVIDFTLFNDSSRIDSSRIDSFIDDVNATSRILVRYLNEYGRGMFVVIEGVGLSHRVFGTSVDDVILTMRGHFTFASFSLHAGEPGEEYAHIMAANHFAIMEDYT